MLLTPEYAIELLANSCQRSIQHQRLLWVLEHFEDMNGTSILVGEGGGLIDGHHRCTVVAVTGRSLEVYLSAQPYHYHHDAD